GRRVTTTLERKQSRGDGVDRVGQLERTRPRALRHLGEPLFRCRRDRHEREIVREQDHPGTVRQRGGRSRTAEQEGFAQALGQVRYQPRQEGRLGWREVGAGSLAVQAHEAPALRTRDEGRPQFVPQVHRSEHLAVARAAGQLALGGHAKAFDRRASPRQSGELYRIILKELALEELGRGLRQDLVAYGAGEEQRRWVGGGEERNIRGDRLPKLLYGLDPKSPGVQPGMRETDDLLPDALR